MRRVGPIIGLLIFFIISPTISSQPVNDPYTIAYYYKVKWGYQEEFLRLFKKNHYPILKKEREAGRILRVEMAAPENHMTEDARWDYRVTIVYKNANVVHEPFDTDAVIRQLYPDRATFDKEEQRRFEILLAHWDLPLAPIDLDKAP